MFLDPLEHYNRMGEREMIYRADYTREPAGPDLPGDFEHYFHAPQYRIERTAPYRARLTDATLTHLFHYGRANGASYVRVYAVDLCKVGYPGANGYGVNAISTQSGPIFESPIHAAEQMARLLAGDGQ